MKAGPIEIGRLLQNRQRFCVPIYQRHYVWTREKQWEPFWNDVRTKAIECLAVFAIAIGCERWLERRNVAAPGAVTGVVVSLWDLSRFFDEYFWLGHDSGTDALEITGLVFFVVGLVGALVAWAHRRPAASPPAVTTADDESTPVRGVPIGP